MARGWESKSVEEQQAVFSAPVEGRRSAADHEMESKKRGLELQIKRVEEQLAAASSERHREMLRKSLDELRSRISKLG